jgi:catechol 2,3-dioxygenase-like lactoylglutathione lyase family enzyme
MPPKLGQVVETILYTSDASKQSQWYKDVLGLEPYIEMLPAIVGFQLPNNTLLLIFNRGYTTEDRPVEGAGMIPKHGCERGLGQHISFACSGAEELEEWEKHIKGKGVEVISEMNWERGGRSIYFKDWEGHVLEIMTRGVWEVY